MADDFGRETVTLEGKLAHRPNLMSIACLCQPSLCDNAGLSANPIEIGSALPTASSICIRHR
jgi:hypothetical protein